MESDAGIQRTNAHGDPGQDEISILQIVNVLLRNRRLVVLTPLVFAVLVVAVSFLHPRSYTATTSFTPQAREGQVSQLAGLASQFGISVPTGASSGQSPRFYADLLVSRELLRETVVTEYEVGADSVDVGGRAATGDLVSLLGVNEDDRKLAVAETIEKLQERVDVSTDLETGVVELSVSARWPELSRQVAERMVELVNRFNLETRRTQASAEREFIEGQVAEAESALRAAEDSLERFLQQNRRYENSPELRFEYERLQRQVSLRQQLFTSLSQSYQQAKIEEVRNTPVITVVEPPERPARPDSRQLMVKGMLGLILGGILAVFWAFGREILASSRKADPDHYAEFARLKTEVARDVKSVWRRVTGRREQEQM